MFPSVPVQSAREAEVRAWRDQGVAVANAQHRDPLPLHVSAWFGLSAPAGAELW